MKARFLLFFSLLISVAHAQTESPESLQADLQKAQSVEARVDILNKLSHVYSQLSVKRAEGFALDALDKAMEVNYQKGIASSYNNLGIGYSIQGDYPKGLDFFIKALYIREAEQDFTGASNTLNNISRLFLYQNDTEKAIEYSKKSLDLLNRTKEPIPLGTAYLSLGNIYLDRHDNEAALKSFRTAQDIFVTAGRKTEEGWALLHIAKALEAEKQYQEALQSCFQAMRLIRVQDDLFTTVELYQTIGIIYSGLDNKQAAGSYLHQAMRLADQANDSNGSMSSRLKLAELFRKFRQYDSALFYTDDYRLLNEKTFDAEKSKQLATLETIYQTEKKDQLLELKNQEIRTQSVIIVVISTVLFFIAILVFVIYRYYTEKKKTNSALEKLNLEIYEKHEEILAQAEELTQANEEISRINESLEAEVLFRAQKIEKQSKKLIDYAYSNAHNVRGPLARILGLTMLMEKEHSTDQLKVYNAYLNTSAMELDNVIRDINTKLQN